MENVKRNAIIVAICTGVLVGVGLVTCLVFWPVFAFDSDAAWVGEVFWIVLLATIIAIAALAARSAEEKASDIRAPFGSVTADAVDRHAFENKVKSCLNDPTIFEYFRRNLVKASDITRALAEGEAFNQARTIEPFEQYEHDRSVLQEVIDSNSATMDGVLNPKTAAVLICAPIIIVLLFVQISGSTFATSGLTFLSAIFAGGSALIFSHARDEGNQYEHNQRRRKLALAGICLCVSVSIIVLPPVAFGTRWIPSIYMLLVVISSLFIFFILGSGQTLGQCVTLLAVGAEQVHLLWLRYYASQSERNWLENCEDIIKEQANLTINSILGKEKDRLLVEQDSEGLRRLQDQSYTVSTRSERRIASVLSQMDAGSIALAGPRGAGKSTLLRKFSGHQHFGRNGRGIFLYLPAPAEYVPRDFIAAFLQQLCETYLDYMGWAPPGPIYRESLSLKSRVSISGFFKFLLLLARTVVAIAIILWITRSFVGTHYNHIYEAILATFKHWYDEIHQTLYRKAYKNFRPYWPWIRVIVLIVTALVLLSYIPRWVRYFKPRTEPELVARAREYLRRLQIEKTVTWGKGAVISSPVGRGASFSLNRGGSAAYVPWTLPELVTQTRLLMRNISGQFSSLSHAIIVGIDEIDRIGSLDHAERFIGEIKAIFGVEKCFFLVAVAEDVGSIFAQRATAGRSILENAFDDIVVVEPLDLLEARDLLLKRVPGFTDSFVYLVHALSGGLPRELIRITRKLVDVNQEAGTRSRVLRLEDLAFCLVREELIEAIRATRNQLARLALHANWTTFFERVHSASVSLRYASPFLTDRSYGLVKELSGLTAPDAPESVPTVRDLIQKDEEEAKRIVRDFTAFSYFGLTIIDAFSDEFFDLEHVRLCTAKRFAGSYEELAVARAELTVSPENSRAMLRRFRDRLSSRGS